MKFRQTSIHDRCFSFKLIHSFNIIITFNIDQLIIR